MKKPTSNKRERELKALAAIPDDQIDTSDIPELTEEQLSRAIRGQMYRPVKKPVTLRLDADVIEWLKKDGPGYQTKANALLRREMIRSHERGEESRRERALGRAKVTKPKTLAGV
jgi:uncharacterized protein (DUF4415 family)